MAAVLVGGIILIWLALSGGRTLLASTGVQLHWPLDLAMPLLLAGLESVLFLVTVPGTALLDASLGWPVAIALVVLAWLINGTVSARLWLRHRGTRVS